MPGVKPVTLHPSLHMFPETTVASVSPWSRVGFARVISGRLLPAWWAGKFLKGRWAHFTYSSSGHSDSMGVLWITCDFCSHPTEGFLVALGGGNSVIVLRLLSWLAHLCEPTWTKLVPGLGRAICLWCSLWSSLCTYLIVLSSSLLPWGYRNVIFSFVSLAWHKVSM